MKCSSDSLSFPFHLILEYMVEKSVVQLEQVGLNARVSGFYFKVLSFALRKALHVKATCKTRELNALFMKNVKSKIV